MLDNNALCTTSVFVLKSAYKTHLRNIAFHERLMLEFGFIHSQLAVINKRVIHIIPFVPFKDPLAKN